MLKLWKSVSRTITFVNTLPEIIFNLNFILMEMILSIVIFVHHSNYPDRLGRLDYVVLG